ncbi:PH domain-containing protein [Lysinibacillus sp. F5]|uniref:PH domain-containing protein n=1 Tax=Lysinibacillus sp. F5 TaxID=1700846 RepID=UPI000738CC7A|nr:PH domain-containing protein [Lysinibacillus sp. F5]KUF35659.1 hypothetical protein AK833_06425 [Lysinibacillus sp. F5]
MVYPAKVNKVPVILSFLMVWLMAAMALWLFATSLMVMIMSVCFILSASVVWWYATSIQFVFDEEYLLVKSGPFKSKIPYQGITKIAPTTAEFTGYQISTADKGLELFYSNASSRECKDVATG